MTSVPLRGGPHPGQPGPDLASLLGAAESRFADKPAFVTPHSSWTFREVGDGARSAAEGLRQLNVGPGEHVGVLMPNSIEFVRLLFATANVGAVLVPLSPRLKPTELSYLVADADLVGIVTREVSSGYVDIDRLLDEAISGLGDASEREHLELRSTPSLRFVVHAHDLEKETPAPAPRAQAGTDAADAAALIVYTSGTTAHPKGCMLAHRSLAQGAALVAERLGLAPADRFWDPLPMFHLGGIVPLLASLHAGAAFLTQEHFEPVEAVDLMRREKATVLYATFPAITQALLADSRFRGDALPDVRLTKNIGPPDLLALVQQTFPGALQIGSYGCTELCGPIAYNESTDTEDQRTRTSGRPLPGNEVVVVDPESDGRLGPDQAGEIWVRGLSVFLGYYQDPSATADVVDDDGWYHTGDLGELDPHGRIRFLGRIRDVVKVGGENVAAAEVEAALMTHPAVRLAQVVGIPDERLGECVAAFVELVPGSDAEPTEIIEHVSRLLARFKVPRILRIVEDWPMSATKIKKSELSDRLVRELASTAKGTNDE